MPELGFRDDVGRLAILIAPSGTRSGKALPVMPYCGRSKAAVIAAYVPSSCTPYRTAVLRPLRFLRVARRSDDDDDQRRAENRPESKRAAGMTLTKPGFVMQMLCMQKHSIRSASSQQNPKRVMARVERGQVIEATRRHRPWRGWFYVSHHKPALLRGPTGCACPCGVGDRILTPGGSEVLVESRGDR